MTIGLFLRIVLNLQLGCKHANPVSDLHSSGLKKMPVTALASPRRKFWMNKRTSGPSCFMKWA
jgi:hypothetical protein